MEPLEERVLLTAIPRDVWTGASKRDSNWSNGGNWSLGRAPLPTDTVVFNGGSAVRFTSTVDVPFTVANIQIDGSGWQIRVNNALTLANGGADEWDGGNVTIDPTNGHLTNQGTLTLGGTQDKQLTGGTLDNGGTVVQASGRLLLNAASVKNESTATYDFQTDNTILTVGNGGSFNNLGLLRKSVGTGVSSVQANLTNAGTVAVQTGTIDLTSALSNFSNATLTGGTYVVSSTPTTSSRLKIAGDVVNNAAAIVLDGPNSQISDPSSASALRTLAGNAAAGSLTIQNGQAFQSAATLSNAGKITVLPGSTYAVAGNLANLGSITLGGSLTASGTFQQSSSGTLNVRIGGAPPAGPIGSLTSGSSATLGGVLNVTQTGGFSATAGQSFKIMNYPSATGTFSAINLPANPAAYQPVFNPTNLTLYAGPVSIQGNNLVVHGPPNSHIVVDATNNTAGNVTVTINGTLVFKGGPIAPGGRIEVDETSGNNSVEVRGSVPADLTGGSGTDLLIGGSGNDNLYAGTGNETLVGGLGRNQIFGAAGGNDRVQESGDLAFHLDGSTLTATNSQNNVVLQDQWVNVSSVTLTGTGTGGDCFDVGHWSGSATINGGAGSNRYTVNLTGSGNGSVTINGNNNGTDSLTVNGPAGAGSFRLTGNQVARQNLSGAETVNYAAIGSLTIATVGPQTYSGAVTLGADTTIDAGTSSVSFSSTVDGAHKLTVDAAAGTLFGGPVGASTALGALGVNGPATFGAGAWTVTTAGAEDYEGAVALAASTTFNASSVTFNGAVSGIGLTVHGAANIGASGGSINTSGAQDYEGAVVLGASSTFTAPAVTFNGALTGGGGIGLTVHAATTIGASGGSVSTGGSQDYEGTLALLRSTVFTAPSVVYSGAVSGGSGVGLTVHGATSIGTAGGSVTTGGPQDYEGSVALGASTTFTAPSVTFNGAVTGGSGIRLTVQGATTIGAAGGSITTGGTQDFEGSVALATGTVLNAPAVTFNGAVSGSGLAVHGGTTFGSSAGSATTTAAQDYEGSVALLATTVLTAPAVTFNGAVSGGAAIGLTVHGATAVGAAGGSIATGGAQDYEGSVALGTGTTFTATSVTFNGTVAGGAGSGLSVHGATIVGSGGSSISTGAGQDYEGSLTLNASTALTAPSVLLNGAVSGPGATTGLTVTAAAIAIGAAAGSVSTGAGQSYNGAVVLAAASCSFSSSQSGSIVFGGKLDGGSNVAIDTGGMTRFAAPVGSATPLASLTTDVAGTTDINGGSVVTTGAQTYNDPVVLSLSPTLLSSTNGGNLTFASSLDGVSALTVTTSGTTTFGGPVGKTTRLTSLTTDASGSTSINGGSVATTGAQTYNDFVTLPAGPAVTTFSGAVSFAGGVSGSFQAGAGQSSFALSATNGSNVQATGGPPGSVTAFMLTGAGGQPGQGGTGAFVSNFAASSSNGSPTAQSALTLSAGGGVNILDFSNLPVGVDVNLGAGGVAQSIFTSANIEGQGFSPTTAQAFEQSTLTLNGNFQQVVGQSGNAFVGSASSAPSGSSAQPGTAFTLLGSGNVVTAGPGDTVTSYSGGNQVDQAFSAQTTTQVNNFTANIGNTVSQYVGGSTQTQLGFLSTQGAIDGTYISVNSGLASSWAASTGSPTAKWTASTTLPASKWAASQGGPTALWVASGSAPASKWTATQTLPTAKWVASGSGPASKWTATQTLPTARWVASSSGPASKWTSTQTLPTARWVASGAAPAALWTSTQTLWTSTQTLPTARWVASGTVPASKWALSQGTPTALWVASGSGPAGKWAATQGLPTAKWVASGSGPAGKWSASQPLPTAKWVAGSKTAVTAFLAGIATDQNTFAAFITAMPAALKTFVAAYPDASTYVQPGGAGLSAYLGSHPGVASTFYQAQSAALVQDVLNDPTDFAGFIAGNLTTTTLNALTSAILSDPTGFANFFAGDAADLANAIVGDPTDFAAYFATDTADLTAMILADAIDFANHFGTLTDSATLSALSSVILADSTDFATYFGSMTDSATLGALTSVVLADAVDFANYFGTQTDSATLSALTNVILANSDGFAQYFGTTTDSGTLGALTAVILADPNDFASFFAGSTDALVATMLADPNDFATSFAGNTDALVAAILADPTDFASFFAGRTDALAAAMLADPTDFATFFANDTAALAEVIQSDPLDFAQFLLGNPALLQQFLGTLNSQALENFFTEAFINFFRLNVTLAGSGNEASGGVLASFQIDNGLFTESLTPDQLTLASGLASQGIPSSSYGLDVSMGGGDNVVVGGFLGTFTTEGTGHNRFVIEDPSLLGLPAGTAIPSALAQTPNLGGSFTGGSGSNTYVFVGGGSGNAFGNVAINDPTSSSGSSPADTLDFSNEQAGPIHLSLLPNATTTTNAGGLSYTQAVIPRALSLTLPVANDVNHVIGSPFSDTIAGNNLGDTIEDSAELTDHPAELAAPPPAAVPVQVIYLDFNHPSLLLPGEQALVAPDGPLYAYEPNGVLSAAVQQYILQGLQRIYAPFGSFVQFTTTVPTAKQAPLGYETVYFNQTPSPGGTVQAGGFSSEVDWRNLSVTDTVQLDVNGFLGTAPGDVAATLEDLENMSLVIAAHEVGHTLGLEHSDAFGPIGFGISNPPGPGSYAPAYAGPVGGFTTYNDIMASPASVGSTVQDAASGLAAAGERDLVALAFVSGGTVVDGVAGDLVGGTPVPSHNSQAQALPVSLSRLSVPNSLASGYDAGKSFDAAAVDVTGRIAAGQPQVDPQGNPVYETDIHGNPILAGGKPVQVVPSLSDDYSFFGQAGDVMNFAVYSSILSTQRTPRPIDSVISVYDSHHHLIATNDDNFESSDSWIIDLTLPATDTYTVVVSSFNAQADPDQKGTLTYYQSLIDPSSSNYDPSRYYGTQTGGYELLMYRFAAYNASSGNDTLTGGTGNDTFILGNGNDTVNGLGGTNTVQQTGSASYTLSSTQLVGTGTDALANIQQANLFDTGGNHTFTINENWTGGATLYGNGGTDTLHAVRSLTGRISATSDLAQVIVDQDLTGSLSTRNVSTITIGGGLSGSLAATGNVGTASVGQYLAGPITVSGSVGTLSIGQEQQSPPGSVKVGGDLGTLNIGQNLAGSVTVGGNLGTVNVVQFVSGPISVGGNLGTLGINQYLAGPVTVRGSVTSLNVGQDIRSPSGSVSVGVDLGTLSVGQDVSGTIAVGGNLGTATIGQSLLGTMIVAGNLTSFSTGQGISGKLGVGGNVGDSTRASKLSGISIGGALQGQVIILGSVSGDLNIKAGLQGGRIAVYGSINGNATIGGTVDATSALVVYGSVGSTSTGTVLTIGTLQGIVAVGGSMNASIKNATQAVFKPESQVLGDPKNSTAVKALFTPSPSFGPGPLYPGFQTLDNNLKALGVDSNGYLTLASVEGQGPVNDGVGAAAGPAEVAQAGAVRLAATAPAGGPAPPTDGLLTESLVAFAALEPLAPASTDTAEAAGARPMLGGIALGVVAAGLSNSCRLVRTRDLFRRRRLIYARLSR